MSNVCPHCKKKFEKKEYLCSHTSTYHSPSAIIRIPQADGSIKEIIVKRTAAGEVHCTQCNKSFKCSVSLRAHMRVSCLGEEGTCCPYCYKTFSSSKLYFKHVENKNCINGARRRNQKKLLKKLLQREKSINTSVLPLTTQSTPFIKTTMDTTLDPKHRDIFKRKSRKHNNSTMKAEEASKKDTKFKCAFCKALFKSRDKLQQHMNDECFEPPYGGQAGKHVCFDCARCFESKADLKMHAKNYHINQIRVHANGIRNWIVFRNEYNKFECPQCSLACDYPGSLETHLTYYCGQTKTICMRCASPFETILQLNTHLNTIHTNHNVEDLLSIDTPEASPSPTSSYSSLPLTPTLENDSILNKKSNKRVRFNLDALSVEEEGPPLKKKAKTVYYKLKHVMVKV